MKLLDQSILDTLQPASLPGTVFVEVDAFTSKRGIDYKVILAIVKRENGWGNPTYATLLKHDDAWVLNPWLNEDLIEVFSKLMTPARAVARIPTELLAELAKSAVTVVVKTNERDGPGDSGGSSPAAGPTHGA